MEIRKYKNDDLKSLESVCLETSYFPHDLDNVVLSMFLYPYIDNILVAVDDNDEIAGYLAFASNFDEWLLSIEQEVKKCRNNIALLIASQEIESLKPYKKEYPAHLHININGSHQRMGFGKKLIETLEDVLKDQNIPGVMLEVNPTNKTAISFYKKNGFKVIEINNSIILGKKL